MKKALIGRTPSGEIAAIFAEEFKQPGELYRWITSEENKEGLEYGTIYDNVWFLNGDKVKEALQFLRKRGFTVNNTLDGTIYNPIAKRGAKKGVKKGTRKKSITVQIYTPEEIEEARKFIRNEMINGGTKENFTNLTIANLKKLFSLYDRVFFNDQISQLLQKNNSKLLFEVKSSGKIVSGGFCKYLGRGKAKDCTITISFPEKLYTSLFTRGEKSLYAGGFKCTDRLHCLQYGMEHEIVHMLMFLQGYIGTAGMTMKEKRIYSEHGKLFQCIIKAYFGHTDYTHGLLSGDADKKLTKEAVEIGMRVKFVNKKSKLEGVVIKKNPKRAKVRAGGLVYNVPYNVLEKQ